MHIIDFEAHFAAYIHEKMHDVDDAEQARIAENIEEIYEKWEQSAQEFLEGQSPRAYFAGISAPELAEILAAYYDANLHPPQALLDALQDKAAEAAEVLLQIMEDESRQNALRGYALELLSQIRDARAFAICRECLLDAPEHPLASAWHHALREVAAEEDIAAWAAREYIGAERAVQRRLLDFIVEGAGTYARNMALEFFTTEAEDRHLPYAASMLAKAAQTGDEEALDALYARRNSDIGYVAYVEIGYAIEQLGGFLPAQERDFSGDADYEYMAGMVMEEDSDALHDGDVVGAFDLDDIQVLDFDAEDE